MAARWHYAEILSAEKAHLMQHVLVFSARVSINPLRYPQRRTRYEDLRTVYVKRRQACTICRHREHAAIDLALARSVSVRALSRRYKVGIDAIYRHSRNHLPAQLRAKLIAGPSVDGVDLDRLRETESQSLLSHLINLRNRLFASLDIAEENGDSGMVARVAAQLQSNFELVAKLLGDLATGSVSVTNILVAPQYIQMRVELVRALSPYPDARRAVAGVLHQLEAKAADTITAESKRGLAS